jgi:two-component system sensor histidine kinase KdpD
MVCAYVQLPRESAEKISLSSQRHLINNFKNATELGAELLQVKSDDIAESIMQVVREKNITTVCLGKPHLNLFQLIWRTSVFNRVLKELSKNEIDLVILS